MSEGGFRSPEPAEGTFSVGTILTHPGEKASGVIEVPSGSDESTFIPCTVVRGRTKGPVFAAIAGIHGYEYPPITALHRLRGYLNPESLAGTVILVHVANMPSFLKRTIYYSPVDGKNLNRVFPGSPDGTVSERIAHKITTEVIEQADCVVDLHGGDGNEKLKPCAYWLVHGDEDFDAETKELAIAFGLEHIVVDTKRPLDPQACAYTANTALTRGIQALTTETGQLGQNDSEAIDMCERGVMNLLVHLGMIDGKIIRPDSVYWLKNSEVLRSPKDGLFSPSVEIGDSVRKGDLIGTLLDYFGDPVEDVCAPFSGMVVLVLGTPPVSEGEPLAMVGEIADLA